VFLPRTALSGAELLGVVGLAPKARALSPPQAKPDANQINMFDL
jgi:hypothetical protein